MQLFTIFAASAALIAGSNALFIPRNIHVADFRLYSAEGCFDGNLGVWTVIDDDFKNGECKGLNGDAPLSLNLTDINQGCSFTAYTNANCTEGKKNFTTGHCFDNKAGWRAWSIKCDYKD
ncbi:hypothetical protein V8C37DRAFT_416348 [Trichoderma ceciliae]